METKPKRKYTRKVKIDNTSSEDTPVVNKKITNSTPDNTPDNTPASTPDNTPASACIKRKPTVKKDKVIKKKIIKDTEEDSDIEELCTDLEYVNMANYTTKELGNKGIYIYYIGSCVNVIKFIKDLQEIKEITNTQVMIFGSVYHYHGFKLDNCFYNEEVPDIEWYKLCFYNDPTICIKIKELPSYTPEHLLKLIKESDTFEDNYVEVLIK